MNNSHEYNLFLKFIDTYLVDGFENISEEDSLILEINTMLKKNNQFFYIADMLQLKMLYTSPVIKQVLGIEPSKFDPGYQMQITHPDDVNRHSCTRSKVMKLCNELYISQGDYSIISTNFRFQDANNNYINTLLQGYAFYSNKHTSSLYSLFIGTNINWFNNSKLNFHFYQGKDMSYFRLPDKELINTGFVFTNREFEIIDLLCIGLDSESIAEKLFLSIHTVDTHRRNIIKKTNHKNTADLIIDLQGKGVI